MIPQAQGFIPEAERFICGGFDIAREEKERRMGSFDHRNVQNEKRREESAVRDETRWQRIDEKARKEEDMWSRYREHGGKARRNKSSVPFNPVHLGYNDGKDGEMLRKNDLQLRHRDAMRADYLRERGNAAGYNPITGEENNALKHPPSQRFGTERSGMQ
jgi:hypothetical protein